MTRASHLCGLCLALLLAGMPPAPQPSFLTGLWDHVRELLLMFSAAEPPAPPAAGGAEGTSTQGNPDLGLEMDPDG